MKDVWLGPLTPKSETSFGKHLTQKPEYLLRRIILVASKENDLILDPFLDSGTTGVVAIKLNRNFIGIDINQQFIDLSERRIQYVESFQRLAQ